MRLESGGVHSLIGAYDLLQGFPDGVRQSHLTVLLLPTDKIKFDAESGE